MSRFTYSNGHCTKGSAKFGNGHHDALGLYNGLKAGSRHVGSSEANSIGMSF